MRRYTEIGGIKTYKSVEKYKILIMGVMIGGIYTLTYCFHAVFDTSIVFTHLYYIPIVIGSIWWKIKGLIVSISVGAFLILSHRLFRHDLSPVADYIRTLMFIAVGFVTATLNEQIARAEKLMATEQKKLRSCAQRLSNAEERQRRHIAAGLHDSVGPKLSAAKILAQTIKSKEAMNMSGQMETVIDCIDSSIKEIRDLIFKLSPKVLYEFGLKDAVESLTESLEQENSLKCHYTYDGPANALDQKIRSIIFRAIRELLMNIKKHAQAQNVYINIKVDSNNLSIIIEDDGVGFNASEVSENVSTVDCFGLFSIHQQLLDIGGQIMVESEVGSGTKVTITAPVENTENTAKVN